MENIFILQQAKLLSYDHLLLHEDIFVNVTDSIVHEYSHFHSHQFLRENTVNQLFLNKASSTNTSLVVLFYCTLQYYSAVLPCRRQ